MANLRQFSDAMPSVGIPSPAVRRTAADTSESVRIQGEDTASRLETAGQVGLAQSFIQAGTMAFQGMEAMDTRRATEELIQGVGEEWQGVPFQYDPNDEAVAGLRSVAEARQSGAMRADEARARASAIARQHIARNPRRAEAIQAAYNNFFSEFGGGAGAFDKTPQEEMQDYLIKQGWQEFGIDPRLAEVDPVGWERQFQSAQQLRQYNLSGKATLESLETGVRLNKMEQESTLPAVVSGMITDPTSPAYMPGQISQILEPFTNEAGEFTSGGSTQAQQALRSLQISTRATMRSQFGDMDNEDFSSIYGPVESLFETAIAVADGSMEADALSRELQIFNDSAVLSMQGANPDAARKFIGISSMVENLPNMPTSIEVELNRLFRNMNNSFDQAVDPTNTDVTPFTGARTTGDRQRVSQSIGYVSEGAASAAGRMRSGDINERQRVVEGFVYGAKAMTGDAESIGAREYADYFQRATQPAVFDNMNEQERMQIAELAAPGVEVFLRDTLAEWANQSSDEVRVTFDTRTNRLKAVPQNTTNMRHIRAASNVNRRMQNSNSVLDFMEKYMGTSSVEALAQQELGRSILDASNISREEYNPEEWTRSLRDILPGRFDPQQAIVSAMEINSGRATQRHIDRLRNFHQQHDLSRTDNEEVLQALQILEEQDATLEEEGGVAIPLEQGGPVSLNLDDALSNLAELEGGFQNNPRDTGNYVGDRLVGTNRGITPAALAAWRGVDAETITENDIRNLTQEEANDIYRSEYYEKPRINQLPSNLQELMLNMGVMSSPERAIRMLQEVTGAEVDGVIGPETIEASESISIEQLAERYKEYLRSLSNYDEFGRGWEARVDRIVGGM